jgi:hypothetical protein
MRLDLAEFLQSVSSGNEQKPADYSAHSRNDIALSC